MKSQVISCARVGHVVSRDKLSPSHLVRKSQRALFQLPFIILSLADILTFEVYLECTICGKSQRAFFQPSFIILPLADISTFEVHSFILERKLAVFMPTQVTFTGGLRTRERWTQKKPENSKKKREKNAAKELVCPLKFWSYGPKMQSKPESLQ